MSRTRLIRPEFFADETMAGVADSTRLFYIGLWTLCDDAGYFEARGRQIAAALYPYHGTGRREKLTAAAMAKLIELGRVVMLECGIHGRVPTLPRHGQKGGTKSETYLSRHRTSCAVRTPSEAVPRSTDKSSSESVSDSFSDSVSEGAQARENEPTQLHSPAALAAASAGGFIAYRPVPKPSVAGKRR